MYERSAIVLERYFDKIFGENKENNLKTNYGNYTRIIEELKEYQRIIEEEEKVIRKFDEIAVEMEKIQNKYKGRKDQTSQMRMSAEIQALYKKNDISMLASFTTFLTLPIMFAMWQAVQRIEILYQTNMFGINLGAKPIDHVFKFEIAYIVLLAIVALTQYFAMKINTIMSKRNPKYRETSQMQSMNMMNNFMTLFIIYFAAIMPAAMSLYWMTTNIITIVRTWYIYIYHVEKAQKEVDQANTNYLTKRQNKK